MDKGSVTVRLQVFFEDPFWRGVFERVTGGKLSVCRVTFGAEPKDCELSSFILNNGYGLRYGPAVPAREKEVRRNPKRIRREIRRQVRETVIGTKAQQALKLQQEQNKTGKKAMNREQKEAREQRRFEMSRQKKKEKHRGR